MKEQTIFMLKKEEHMLYEEIYEQYKILELLVYELEQVGPVTKYLLKDFFFLAYKPGESLIIYPGLNFSYSYRTFFAEKLMRSGLLKKYGWKLQGNALYSFCFAIYLAQFTVDWLAIYLKKYPERVEELCLLTAHSSASMEELFENSYESPPKDILIANSNLVKYVTSLMGMESNVFEQGIRSTYLTASRLYEDLSVEDVPAF